MTRPPDRQRQRSLAAALVACVLLTPLLAAAQDHNRVLVRTRDNVATTGEFEDLYQGTVFIRVSPNDQRRIPLDQIMFMNFEGRDEDPREEIALANGPHHLLVLKKDTLRVKGQLLGIEGGAGSQKENQPRLVAFRDADGRVGQFRMGDLLRLYLIDFPGAAPAPVLPPKAEQLPDAIQVPANVRWVSTGVIVRKGQQVSFRSSGQVQLSGNADDLATPGGSVLGRTSSGGPLPGVSAGALVGRVGLGTAFGIGDQSGALQMPAAGELFLAVNDDSPQDNRGAYQVVVTPR